MKKFAPNIVIWNVAICDKDDNYPLINYYFLFYKRANKFFEKQLDEYGEDYRVVLGGETLWLGAIKE